MTNFDELLDDLEEERPWITLLRQSYQEAVAEKYVRSIELSQEALKLNPKSSEAYRLIGNAYEFLGDEKEMEGDSTMAREFHNKATEAWDRARDINPKILIPGYHSYRPRNVQHWHTHDMNVKERPLSQIPRDSQRVAFWTKIQLTSLGAFLASVALSFFLSWWLLVVAIPCLVFNGIAYSKRMKAAGRNPATHDIDEVL